MTAGQYIDYEALAQEAMRGIIRAVLTQIGQSGLHGDHHFYIAFNTQAPGVVLSKRLKEKYPAEMTIVLQHRFWDLEVSEDRFEVKLTFDGIPERLAIPFKAVKVFYDPSVPYGLQFEESELAAGGVTRRGGRDGPADAADRPRVVGMQDNTERPEHRVDRPRRPRQAKPEARADKPERPERAPIGPVPPSAAPPAMAPLPASEKPARAVPAPAAAEGRGDGKPAPRPVLTEVKPAEPAPAPQQGGGGDAKVVDLSKFRKK